MKLRHRFLFAFLAVQAVLITLGSLELPIPGENPVSRSLRTYSHYSGAGNSYAFFAPTASSEHRFLFVMTDGNGREWTETMDYVKSPEARLRLRSIPGYLGGADPEIQFRVMRSVASKMLSRHPQAKRVTVQYQVLGIDQPQFGSQQQPEYSFPNFPRMNQVRAGAKPRWHTFDAYSFTRDRFGDAKLDESSLTTQTAATSD